MQRATCASTNSECCQHSVLLPQVRLQSGENAFRSLLRGREHVNFLGLREYTDFTLSFDTSLPHLRPDFHMNQFLMFVIRENSALKFGIFRLSRWLFRGLQQKYDNCTAANTHQTKKNLSSNYAQAITDF